jgi:CysZ protein
MFWQELKAGFNAYGRAHRVIVKHSLWGYLIIPGIASLCYAILLTALAFFFYDDIADWGSSWTDHSFWSGFFWWLISILFWVLVIMLIFFTHKYVTLMLLSPFLAHLSEVVESREYGRGKIDSSFREIVRDMIRGITVNLRNLLLEFFFCLFLNFIPFIGFLLCMMVQGFYIGFSLMDYTLERQRLGVSQSAQFVRRHRGSAYGIGIAYNLIMLIPVVGWFFAPTYGTIASTLVTIDALDAEKAAVKSF